MPPKKRRPSTPKIAPDDLELVQAFVNTYDFRNRHDEVASARELERWLERRGLLPAGVELDEADRRRAVAVRKALRALAAANSGRELDAEAVNSLDEAVAGVRYQLRFDTDGSSRFEPVGAGVDAALGKLLEIVTAARLRDLWPRFKICASGDCQAAYYDASGHSRWCSRRCGDRMRSRAYRRGDRYRLRFPPKRGPRWI